MEETQENNNNSIHTSDTNDEEYMSFKEFLSTPPGSPATSRQKNTKDEVDDGKVEDNNDKKEEEAVVAAAAPVVVTTHTTRSSSSDELLEKGLPIATNTLQQDDADDNVEDYINNEQYKQNKCHRIMHFTSTILFVIGSVLYLIMSVKDYKWANKLNTLPMYLRLADDDITWINYRLEEQYNASLLLDGEGGGGGVRRMKTRELWRMREEEVEEAQRKLEHGQVNAAGAPDPESSHMRRKLQAPEELYYDEDWNDLPPEIQDAYTILGFTEDMWDLGVGVAFSEALFWDELSPEEQAAASLLGYSKQSWDNADAEEEGTLASYVSYDDDYVIQGTAKNADLWISEYQIYYFFAALCFVCVGLLDLIRERHIFHVLMIFAGSFSAMSAIYIEANIELSNVFNCVSVHLFLFEALYIFGDHKRSGVSIKTASWIKRTLMLGDLEFVVGALLDVILSYMYLFDDTSDWDVSLTIVAIFAAVCWLHCSIIYIAAYFYAPEYL